MTTRNMELKTVSKVVTSETSALNIGGQVPAGMKRWVTFIGLDTMLITGASSVKLYLASVSVSIPTKASLIATGNRKMVLNLRATGLNSVRNQTPDGPPLMIPDKPDTNKPLFSIAASKWLGVWASYTSANVTLQYFDE